MQLGALIAGLEDETNAATALEALGDLVLFAQVRTVGARFEEEPGAYVANSVRRFAARATSETWLALMTALERSDDPARSALQSMLRWALAEDEREEPDAAHAGCSCSGHAVIPHDHL